MSDALKKLKDLGAQKIYEDTHIPTGHVQAVLNENYEGLTRVQYLGFLSILEREYNIDLEEERARAIAHYEELSSAESLADDGIFVVPPRVKKFTLFYISLALVIFLAALYYTLDMDNDTNTDNINAAKAAVAAHDTREEEKIQKDESVESLSSEMNTTASVVPNAAPQVKEVTELEPLEILPRSRVWLGYIDVATDKKRQKTFADEFDLNGSKEWLLLFGHGYIDVIAGGEKYHFSEKNGLRLHYQDGMLEKISLQEFKKLNRGRKW